MEARRDIPLWRFTSWRVGGVADLAFFPRTLKDCRNLGDGMPILGGGTNVLVADGSIATPVVCLSEMDDAIYVNQAQSRIVVGAGAKLPRIALAAARAGLVGFEFMGGIPGSAGGAIVMNAGTGGPSGPSVSQVVETVDCVGAHGLSTRAASDLKFGYRRSALTDMNEVVVSVTFRAQGRADPRDLILQHQMGLARRRAKQPIGKNTAGSVFLPTPDGMPAAILIERCGLKGAAVGSARVSPKHANWIETVAGGRADEVARLIAMVQDRVMNESGVLLEREVHYFPDEAVLLL